MKILPLAIFTFTSCHHFNYSTLLAKTSICIITFCSFPVIEQITFRSLDIPYSPLSKKATAQIFCCLQLQSLFQFPSLHLVRYCMFFSVAWRCFVLFIKMISFHFLFFSVYKGSNYFFLQTTSDENKWHSKICVFCLFQFRHIIIMTFLWICVDCCFCLLVF